MKRRFLILSFLALTFIGAEADVARTVMLRHDGNSTFFKYDEVQQAVASAIEGDTIYLTEGSYQPFNIDKRIIVRGVGPTTIIEGNCEININGTAKINKPVFDAVFVNGDIIVNSAYDQFTLRKCKMVNLTFKGTAHYDVKLTQCWVTGCFDLTNNIREFNAFNSRFETLYPHDYGIGPARFEHCGIKETCGTIYRAEFISSYIYKTTNDAKLVDCVFESCLTSGTLKCVNPRLENTTFNYSYGNGNTDYKNTSSTGKSADGTYIGIYGGQLPYKLEPELPTVTNHQLSVDRPTKTMHVNLTITKP